MREFSGGPMEELSTAISRKLGSYPTSHQVKGRANPPSNIFRVLVCQEHQGYLLPSIISRPLTNIHKNLTEESWPMIDKPSPVIMDEVVGSLSVEKGAGTRCEVCTQLGMI